MILDALWMFTGGSGGVGNNDGSTDSPTTGAQFSSNVVDLAGPALPASSSTLGGTPGRDLGIGDDPALKLMVLVTTAMTGGTNFAVSVQGAPDNGSGGVGSYVTLATGPTILTASLTAGVRLFDIDFPRSYSAMPEPPRFIRLGYTSSGTYTAGKIEGLFVLDRNDQIVHVLNYMSGYPPGITVAN